MAKVEMVPVEFEVVNIPKLQPEEYTKNNKLITRLAEKTRELRLHALKTAPEAFGSSYETEVKKDIGQTIERLKTPQADHFFAVDRAIAPWTIETHESFFESLLNAKWVAMIVLIGPLTTTGSLAISSKRDPLSLYDRARADAAIEEGSTKDPLHYHLNGFFVDPICQRAGVGTGLLRAVLNKAAAEATRRAQQLHCTILVDDGNLAAQKLYEKVGFCATGKESYIQQPRLRMGEMKEQEKLAIKMERST